MKRRKLKRKPIIKDAAFFSRIGRKGGLATKRRKLPENPDYFSDLGFLGGEALFATRGKDHYRQILKNRKFRPLRGGDEYID